MSTSRNQNYLNRPIGKIVQDLRVLVRGYHQHKADITSLITRTLQALWREEINWKLINKSLKNKSLKDKDVRTIIREHLSDIANHPDTPEEIKLLEPMLMAVLNNTLKTAPENHEAAMEIIIQETKEQIKRINKYAPHDQDEIHTIFKAIANLDPIENENLQLLFKNLAIAHAKNYFYWLDELDLKEKHLSFKHYISQQYQVVANPLRTLADAKNLKIKINAINETLKTAAPTRTSEDSDPEDNPTFWSPPPYL